jgi:hypothetical protein
MARCGGQPRHAIVKVLQLLQALARPLAAQKPARSPTPLLSQRRRVRGGESGCRAVPFSLLRRA